MKKFKLYALLFVAMAAFSSCEDEVEAPGTAYASFEAFLGQDITVSPNTDFPQAVNIYSANITGSDRTIPLTLSGTLDASSYEAPTTVTIPANTNVGTLNLVFKDNNLDIITDKTLTISMSDSAELAVGGDITFNVAKGCNAGSSKFKIAVALDAYPEEVYWRVVDTDAGAIVIANNATAAFGGYAGLSGTQRDATCLPTGNYVFEIFDSYQDGGGAVSFTIDGVQVFSTNGAYGAGTDFAFSVN
jgi:hypothetical protein